MTTSIQNADGAPAAATGRQQFASDNYAGACPQALHWLCEANASGHEPAYGDDRWTQRATDMLRQLFEIECDVYFVFNGTAANSLALASLCQSYHSVICSPVAHIETDECGGPEFFSNGSKLLVAENESPAAQLGKLTPEAITSLVTKRSDIHYPRPKVVSITQATEMGTVYSVDEVHAISRVAKEHQLRVHMDGARFANAVAHLGCSPADITWRAGVDVLCFGGTKNGLPVGEAVVFFDHKLSEDFAWRVKQAGQLASKMRFISAPWVGLLEHEVWLHNARHANAMAQKLYAGLRAIPGITTLHPPQANGVFAHLPPTAVLAMHAKGWKFYQFIAGGGCRFMCAWDTTEASVEALLADLRAVMGASIG
ncbi:low specificity L-threonine aldolase [Rhodoferax sp. U2-2l]|uniref:threonine aldolase family protein n=1 Tax=Rhodoferax sp. U2-2l TaxID=2884000 RepID=UPI001D0BB3F3|nr:low specificity L-threonine aldolase [Rhodoferax sp. U2-2l]MCB8748740.1 low specificity L-threonine aldolase [Rhodoferax sp. U2-2l]